MFENVWKRQNAWWRHQMETFSVLLALCAMNSPVPGDFPAQRPVTLSFDVLCDLRLNKRLSKQSWGWRFVTLSRPLWRHCNGKISCIEYHGDYFVWTKHENLYLCTGSRVNANHEGNTSWIGAWFRIHDLWISETPLTTHSDGQRAKYSVMAHPSKVYRHWQV